MKNADDSDILVYLDYDNSLSQYQDSNPSSSFAIPFSSSLTISSLFSLLKSQIQEDILISYLSSNLSHNDERTLSQYGIKDGDHLIVSSSLPSPPSVLSGTMSSSAPLFQLPSDIINSLRSFIFGNQCTEDDIHRWEITPFSFYSIHTLTSHSDLFVLEQTEGGVCGVIAGVQSYILLHLFFSPFNSILVPYSSSLPSPLTPMSPLNIPLSVLNLCLVHSFFFIIKQAKLKDRPYHDDEKSVIEFFSSHLEDYKKPGGLLLFLYSLILSVSLDSLYSQIDDISSGLVRSYGYTSQELLNLLLCGQCSSYLFDGERRLGDEMILKGLQKPSQIGFLTMLECLKYTSVGKFYKYPLTPIWVIGSTSHYSVVFSLERSLCHQSTNQQELNRYKGVFDSFDIENKGFVDLNNLSSLIENLKCPNISLKPPNSISSLAYQFDPDRLGIIMWSNLVPHLLSVPSTWSCSTCTFLNNNTSKCSMCEKSYQHSLLNETNNYPSHFTLFHVNGLHQHSSSPLEINPSSVSSPPSPSYDIYNNIRPYDVIPDPYFGQIFNQPSITGDDLTMILSTLFPGCSLNPLSLNL